MPYLNVEYSEPGRNTVGPSTRTNCINAGHYAMLHAEGGVLTTEAYMGTVAIEVETCHRGAYHASDGFSGGDVRLSGDAREVAPR